MLAEVISASPRQRLCIFGGEREPELWELVLNLSRILGVTRCPSCIVPVCVITDAHFCLSI